MPTTKITSYDQLPPLEEWLRPDFENGKLYWKVDRGNYPLVGKEAGGLQRANNGATGYWNIHCLGWPHCHNFRRGKVLYYLRYGIWPLELDHINRNSLDDRIGNLREISRNKNMWNRGTTHPGKGLPYGVKARKNNPRVPRATKNRNFAPFAAVGSCYGHDYHIGYFNSVPEAKEAYDELYQQYYGKDLTVDYYTDVEQGSELWHFLRQNRITATRAYQLLKGKTVDEIIRTDNSAAPFTGNYWTKRGHLLENEARLLYQDLNKVKVREVGGIINSKYPRGWYSPDGCVGLDGLIECKCFSEKHHLAMMEKVDSQIYCQMQFGLFISERDWIDLCLYNPEIEDLSKVYFQKRFYPNPDMHKIFKEALDVQVSLETQA